MRTLRLLLIVLLAWVMIGAAPTSKPASKPAGPRRGAAPIEVVQSFHEAVKQKRVADAFDLHWDVGIYLRKVFDDAYEDLSEEDQEKARKLYSEYYHIVMGSEAIAEMMASAGYSNYKEVSTNLPQLKQVSFHFKTDEQTVLNKLFLERSGREWRIVDQQTDGPTLSRSARSKWFRREHNVTVLEYLENMVKEAKVAVEEA